MYALLLLLAALASPREQIRAVLEAQQAAWNRGDVRSFMDGYEDSKATTFVGTAVAKGRARILERYLKSYASREQMGELAFSDVEITPLCADYASVLGRFHLKRTAAAGGDAAGLFTLLFHRTGAGWKIVLDHTSSAP